MNLKIGENLRRFRRERELTQEEVASHLGVSFQAVSKWERNEGYPDITLLPAIANYFGVTVDALIGMEDVASAAQYETYNRRWTENRIARLHAANVALMKEALAIFPNDALLLVQLSASLERLD
ncbi:MAG: helix-turn-helix transcriptional regulator, partial [Clostridia bacterium]|nr:helix-turn-helix transcriptional regulator [Clostridia bacterium]